MQISWNFCKQCGECFEKSKYRSNHMFCSNYCAHKWRYNHPKYSKRTCRNCGKPFIPKGSERISFCSRECFFESIKRREPKERLIPNRRARPCSYCGGIIPKPGSKKVCDGCRVHHFMTQQLKYDAAKRTSPRTYKCKRCGREITVAYANKKRKFCSDTCLRRWSRVQAKAVRRARKRNVVREKFHPIEVFMRDGWRCRLCGIDTPASLRGTLHDQAPELDHVIPLSRGGPHTMNNTQCLCRKCNSDKGNEIMEETQLILC